MKYIFIVNGRNDRAYVKPELEAQLAGLDMDWEIYVTKTQGDATRYVNVYCDLNPKEEVCFVACGGAGTTNEVATGLVWQKNKYLAVYACGGTNDLLKSLPAGNYHSVDAILKGKVSQIDVIKVNDNYAFNVANIGMDATVAMRADEYASEGLPDPYVRGVRDAVLSSRFHKMKIVVDGRKLPFRWIQQGVIANGQYCGGEFHCAPTACVDDGLMDVVVMRAMTLLEFFIMLGPYRRGEHLTNRFCRRRLYFNQAKSVDLYSKNLIYVCIDGEIVGALHFRMDLLSKALNIIIPAE